MQFIERFTNIDIEVNKTLVHTFIKKIEDEFLLEWKTEKGFRTLMINGDHSYYLSFIEMGEEWKLSLDELITTEKILADALNELLFEARKKKMGIENIMVRKHRRAEKRKLTLQEIRNRREEEANRPAPISNKAILTTIKLEIDYLLMELNEAISDHEQEKASTCKKRLQELVEQSNAIKQS